MKIKSFSFKSLKKFLKLNLVFSLILSIVISLIFFFSILNSFKKEIYTNIKSNENYYTQKNSTLFDNSIYQISIIAARCSVIPNSLTDETSEIDFIKQKYLNSSIENYKFAFNYISDITYLDTNDKNPSNPNFTIPALSHLGDIGNISIGYQKNYNFPYSMYMKYNEPSSVYKHNILIEVESASLSKTILINDYASADMIVDKNGKVILSLDTSLLGKNILSSISNKQRKIREGFFESDFANENCFISVTKSERIDAYTVRATPVATYDTQIRNVYLRTAILTISIFVCSALLNTLIVVISYKPIKLILDNCKNYFPDESGYEIFENEVDYINTNIMKAMKSHDNIAIELQKNTKSLQTAQINSLQAQINPHFIFNTLDALKWFTIDENGIGNPIEKCIVKLEQILRASIDMYNNIIPFERELFLSKSYVDLMHLRYKNLFTVNYNIEKSIEKCSVIKFIMQPIIENCIKHGFANKTSGGEINIVAKEDHNSMLIEISDNGWGIEEEQLAEIRQNLLGTTEITSSHVGLYNVNSRIKLLYGADYGVEVNSTKNVGTTCFIRLPL